MSYLLRHPDAEDTLDGIVTWWLSEQRIVTATRTVRDALEGLIADQLVIGRTDGDRRRYFRLNRRRLQAARRFEQGDPRSTRG